jgi:hypothetical protein
MPPELSSNRQGQRRIRLAARPPKRRSNVTHDGQIGLEACRFMRGEFLKGQFSHELTDPRRPVRRVFMGCAGKCSNAETFIC